MGGPFDLERSAASVEAILRICGRRGRILILMQNNPDPDAIASAAVLRELLAARLKKRAVIAYGGICGRAENRAMMRVLHIEARCVAPPDLASFATICLVDTQPQFGNNVLGRTSHSSGSVGVIISLSETKKLARARNVEVVIDHHLTPRGVTVTGAFRDLRPDYGATSTILYEYALAAGLTLRVPLATALFYGIQSDTQDLGREAAPADVAAYLNLFMLADKAKLARIHRAPLPMNYFQTLRDSLTSCVVAGSTVISAIPYTENPDMMAEVADRMLRLEGISAAVCYGVCGETIHLSARTTAARGNAARHIRSTVRHLGSGGGHNTVAGGQIPVEGDPDKRMALVYARVLKAFAPHHTPRPLLPASALNMPPVIKT